MTSSKQSDSVVNRLMSDRLPFVSVLLWILTALYVYVLLISPPNQLIPGEPVWAIQPDTVQELLNESTNFFFILPILNTLGIRFMQAPIIHPGSEALFNLAEAWIFMFLPLLLADPRGKNLPKWLIWSLSMFLTNTFLIPYMALRSMTSPLQNHSFQDEENASDQLRNNQSRNNQSRNTFLMRGFGWIGLVVGTIAIGWAVGGRPEFGDIPERAQYMMQCLITDRLTIAFCVDLVFFFIFQVVLLGAIEPPGSKKRWLRFVPFWGLALWLIA